MATTIEGAIVAKLLSSSTLTSLIGNSIHPVGDPRKVGYPKVTYQLIDTVRNNSVGGFTNDGPTGLAIARIQFDAWATDLLDTKAIVRAIRQSLNGYSGTSAGIIVSAVFIDDERDGAAIVFAGWEKPIQRCSLDARIMYTETL